MNRATYYVGHVHDVLAKLPDDSVDLVMTSPPFLALRSYLPDDHPDKALEIGSEPGPGEFIDALLEVVEALDRVLAPHGTIVFELGDTYSGSGGHGGDYNPGGMREGQPRFDGSASRRFGTGSAPRPARSNRPKYQGDGRRDREGDTEEGILPARNRGSAAQRDEIDGWPLDKSLCMIPELFRFALAYGFNPLTGRPTPRWRVRNVVRWCRPNPPVGALSDKFRPGTSDLVVACHSKTRYFDLDAVRTEPIWGYTSNRPAANHREVPGQPQNLCNPVNDEGQRLDCNPGGTPPLDHWLISTQPYKGSHYATFPDELVVKPVMSMCPEKVCLTCGEPSRRLTEPVNEPCDGFTRTRSSPRSRTTTGPSSGGNVTTGWSDCGHDSWRPGMVLDPFAGSGTTLAVATGHGREAIGIDLDYRNVALATDRVGGLFLEVVDARSEASRSGDSVLEVRKEGKA